ncbi:MAG: adenine phosphoribosyltransferase [Chloroflexi bacterium]|nr:adenine phosphoribosyltransferase [Chloroflexota bacterium]
MDLASLVRNIPDFPVKGIQFKDVTTLLKEGPAFNQAIMDLVAPFAARQVELVAAVESRGFIFGAPAAYQLKAGFVPVRKLGKLPAQKINESYTLEYGAETLEMHIDALAKGQRVLIVDDLIATGGSARATVNLIERLGGQVVGLAFLIELKFLSGRERLPGYDIHSVIQY